MRKTYMVLSGGEEGSSLAEMTILLPIYVILVTAAIYFAHIGLARIGAQKAVGYAAAQSGQQGLGDVADLMPVAGLVSVTDFDDPVNDEELWTADDIDAVLEEVARAPVGHYEYQDGEIVYILDEERLSAYGRYIFDNNLQDESENIAEILEGWLYRSRSVMSCRYEPAFGDWDAVNITEVSSSSYVPGDQDRGSHLPDAPDFNTEIFSMLSGDAFPAPISAEPELWLSQTR